MSNLLLDTHVFIWLMNGDSTLPTKIRKTIRESLLSANVYIQAISCWEIAMLESKKRIVLTKPCLDWIQTALTQSAIQIIPLSAEVSVESCQLPDGFHEDPADRIIVASARLHDLTLITRDKRIHAYSNKHYVRVLKA